MKEYTNYLEQREAEEEENSRAEYEAWLDQKGEHMKNYEFDAPQDCSSYESCTAEARQAGFDEGIDALAEMLTNSWGLSIILSQTNGQELKSFILHNAEQIKEQK